jgi:hypothetical protein
MSNYHFVTHWRVRGTVQEVTDILRKGSDLPKWWPAVYLEAKEVDSGDENGVGYIVDLYTKGWLPYTIRWSGKSVETHHPYGFTIETSGDFVGRGAWTFQQDGEHVNITYDWQIRADKPLLRYGAFLFAPVYELNHKWAMATGEESLKLELDRRHAKTPEEKAAIPAPPKPTTTSPLPLLAAVLGTLATGSGLIYLLTRLVR